MTSPVPIRAGRYPTAAAAEYWNDTLENLKAPGWTDYSSSMTVVGSISNPTLGNSTLQAFYRAPAGTDVVDFTFKLTIGSTFSAGSGTYTFSLPVPMLSPQIWPGHATYFETGVAFRTANLVAVSANGLITYHDGSGTALGSGGPGSSWTTGDYVAGFIRYGVSA